MPRHRLSLILVLAVTGTAHAQGATPRYRPPLGTLTRTVTELRTTTTLVGFPTVPDGATRESEEWISGSQRVTAFDGDLAVVDVTIDSVRGRVRMGTEPWVDRADSTLVGHPAQAVVSPRFGIVGIRSSNATDADVLQPFGAYVAGLGFAFPETPIAPGSEFGTGGRLRARVQTAPESGLPTDDVVVGDLSFVLDSVTGGTGEELAFFSFRGSFLPRTSSSAAEDGDLQTTLTGAFAGRVVWSAAWNAFVSGAVRVRVDGVIRRAGPAGADEARVTWDRTILHRVRP